MSANVFEQIPDDVAAVTSIVRRAALEECSGDTCLIGPFLDKCAAQAVVSYWDSRIKTFVPLLALRQVRECIRVGACPDLQLP